MAKYNLLKLKNYLVYLTIGALILVFGCSVLYSIISEMVQMYDDKSKYAYIGALIVTGIIIAIGLIVIRRAFGFEKQVMKDLTSEEKILFFEELEDSETVSFDRYICVTKHFIMCHVKSTWMSKVCVLKIDDLVGCFGNPHFAGSDDLVQYDVVLCDKDFHLYRCIVKGKRAAKMEDAIKAICSYAPWVFSDDYMDFVSGLTKRKKKRSYLKIVEHRKQSIVSQEDALIVGSEENNLQ